MANPPALRLARAAFQSTWLRFIMFVVPRRRAAAVLFALVVLPSFILAADPPPQFDLVLRNGRVVDGTGNPWFAADVAISGDRIAAIGKIPAGSGKREFDARKLIVAPGFIDVHSFAATFCSRQPREARFARASPPKSSAKEPPRDRAEQTRTPRAPTATW
jgi:hypothetical protein